MWAAALSAASFPQCLGGSESWEWVWGWAEGWLCAPPGLWSSSVCLWAWAGWVWPCFVGIPLHFSGTQPVEASSGHSHSISHLGKWDAEMCQKQPQEPWCSWEGRQQHWQGCECLLVTVLSLQGSSQVPGKQVVCGFWREIPTGLCQMHSEMKVPLFSLLLVSNSASPTSCTHSCRFYLLKFPFTWQNFSLLINCCWSTNGLHWK